MEPSMIKADIELQSLLKGKVVSVDSEGKETSVKVYLTGERSGINVPDDFIDVEFSGDPWAIDRQMGLIRGYLVVTLYVKLNSDNTIKRNRVSKILSQFDTLVNKVSTENYYYEYLYTGFMTPTTASTSIGYSVTTLALQWHTK